MKTFTRTSRYLILLMIISGIGITESFTQDKLYINGSRLTIKDSTNLYIKGDLVVKKNNMNGENIHNEGTIYLTDSLINEVDSLFLSSSNPPLDAESESDPVGEVSFRGALKQSISGRDTIYFSDLTLDNDSGLYLGVDIKSLGDIRFLKGNLYLNNHDIDLYELHPLINRFSGNVANENENNRIIDNKHLFDTTNFVRAYSPGNNYNKNIGNLGAMVNKQYGKIYVERGNTSLSGVTSTSLPRFYNFYSDKTSTAGDRVIFNYLDSDFDNLSYNESEIIILSSDIHQEIYKRHPVTLDTLNNMISASNLNLLRRYVISSSNCDEALELNLPSDTTVCFGDSTELTPRPTVPVEKLFCEWYRLDNSTLYDTATVIKVGGNMPEESILYALYATDSRGCRGGDTVRVTGKTNPDARFQISMSRCEQDSISFLDVSVTDEGELSYLWDFGNGDTSSLQDPFMVYPQYGAYMVKQIVTNSYNCSDEYSQAINIYEKPVAEFEYKKICTANQIYFNNESYLENKTASVVYSEWTINGIKRILTNTQALNSITEEFNNPGTYPVSLIVRTDAGNCLDTIMTRVHLFPTDIPAFAVENICAYDTTRFINNSTVHGNGAWYTWNFGDGSISTDSNAVHLFSEPGQYKVTLSVENNNCLTSITKMVDIYESPSATLDLQSDCAGEELSFGTIPKNNHEYIWTIEGQQLQGNRVFHAFTRGGNYNINLQVINTFSNCKKTYSEILEVYPKPEISFNIDNACDGQQISLKNTTSIYPTENMDYIWDFGDQAISNQKNPVHTYTDGPGIKEISLSVVSQHGCSSSLTQTIEVYPLPEIGFPALIGTCGDSYILSSKDAAVFYLWSDLSTDSEITINTDGTYWLEITDIHQCTNSDTVAVALETEFQPVLPETVSGCGTAILTAGYYPGAAYQWSDGETTYAISVSSSQAYSLTVTDQNNCTGVTSTIATINPLPQISLGSDRDICEGDEIEITAITNASEINWSNGAINVGSIMVNTPGKIYAQVFNSYSCTASDEITIIMHPLPALYLEDMIGGCNSLVIDPFHSGPDFIWSTGETTQQITVSNSGTYSVTVTDENNCSASDESSIVIESMQPVNLGNDMFLCDNQEITVNAGAYPNNYQYVWNTGSDQQIQEITESGMYYVRIVSPGECMAADTIMIKLYKSPAVNLASDIPLCHETAILNAGSDGTSYQWTSDHGFSSTQPIIEVQELGNYYLSVGNENCTSRDTVNLYYTDDTVNAMFLIADNLVGDSLRVFDTIVFYNLSMPDYADMYWDFGDYTNSTEKQPKHIYYAEDRYSIKLVISNQVCSDSLAKERTICSPYFVVKRDLPKEKIEDDAFVGFLGSKVYPNPNTGYFTFEFELSNPSMVVFYITDINGRTVHFEKVTVERIYSNEFYIGQLPKGMYILRAIAAKEAITHKIILY